MKKIALLFLLSVSILCLNAQNSSFFIISAKCISQDVISVELSTYCKVKKQADKEAMIAAVKAIMFKGLGVSPYTMPLLEFGEASLYGEFANYFNSLYSYRYTDFIKQYKRTSGYKKYRGRSTSYEVEVFVLRLRKDLEINNIKCNLTL